MEELWPRNKGNVVRQWRHNDGSIGGNEEEERKNSGTPKSKIGGRKEEIKF